MIFFLKKRTIVYFRLMTFFILPNSIDRDEFPHDVAFHLALHFVRVPV